MKKLFILSALICVGVLFSASAKEKADYKYEYQEATVSYRNVQIYKILDHNDAYIVMYAKGHRDVGTVTIPKKWYTSSMRSDSKLTFRPLPKGMNPYMTVLNRDGSFERVILTLPVSRASAIWGVADSTVKIDDADKDTLDIKY
ncbi:MAG: hypothetical protein IJ630_04050 [Treponema sp.]|nr:hypothetical protein [Treponema sp.]